MRVLLIEDNPGDVRLIRELLRHAEPLPDGDAPGDLHHVPTLAAGVDALRTRPVDVILLDLGLPESEGLETFRRLRNAAPDVPAVVLSGLDDRQVAIQAVREGAQDYLVKGQFDEQVFERSLRYAIARWRAEVEHTQRLQEQAARAEAEASLRRALEAEREQRERLEREVRAMQRLSHPGSSTVTSSAYGLQPMRTAAPDAFGEAVQVYGTLLDRAIEQRVYRVEHDVSTRLRALADQVGFLRAGPRDVVELHTVALRERLTGVPPARAQAYIEEARVLVLELMGHLVSHYRNRRTSL